MASHDNSGPGLAQIIRKYPPDTECSCDRNEEPVADSW